MRLKLLMTVSATTLLVSTTAMTSVMAQTYFSWGNSIYGSDGFSATRWGNTVYGNDGYSSTRWGNSIYGNDGSSCVIWGNVMYCN